MMRHCRIGFLGMGIVALALSGVAGICSAQVVFSGGTYSQDFNTGLPLDKANNASLGGTPAGWVDNNNDGSPAANQFGLPGWYLYHPTDQSAGEGGANGHQRLRLGDGSSNTGAFYLFSSDPDGGDPLLPAANSEKSLGMLNATTLAGNGANAYIGLRLTNTTGSTLNSFTLSFDGEQWRDGQSTTPETLLFGYSTSATTGDWATTGSFTSVPQLNFTAPASGGSNVAVDGNAAGKASLTANVFGLNWASGADLWLRWADSQLESFNDDGLSIDNLVFTAPSTGPPPDIDSVMSGSSSAGSTWSDNNPPSPGLNYHVLSGHTVTVDAPFAGSVLKAESGGTINIGPTGNGVDIPNMTIAAGGALTETVSGDFTLGDITNPASILQLDNDVAFTIDPGPASPTCDLCLNMKIQGAGNIDINSAPGTSVSIPKASSLTGTINFNGTGDTVKIDGTEALNKIVMNSTGQNRLVYAAADVASATFNQPGIIDHATTTASRLQGGALVANAQVTIDLTKGYPDNTTQSEERRFETTSFTGSGNVIVNGTAVDYTAGSVTLNEFELGTTGEPSGNVPGSTYSGTLSANDFVNVEIRRNIPRAGLVVNQNARADFGFQVQHPDPNKFVSIGEVAVNSGGILEVGFEQGPDVASPFYAGTGHENGHLNITSARGRSGNLTMTNGATLRMQINGINADQYDLITATGNVNLGGATLDLLANPPCTNCALSEAYFPTDGDTFTIININAAPVQGDYDGNGTVGAEDYDAWRAAFGATGLPAADGNNNGVVDAADYLIWRKNLGQSSSVTGSITGMLNVNVLDPYGSWTGFNVVPIYTPTSVQLKFVASGSGSSLAAVPEPSTIGLLCLLLLGSATLRGRSSTRRRR